VTREAGRGERRLCVGDSKRIYRGSAGLRRLEETALAFFSAVRGERVSPKDGLPRCFDDLLRGVGAEPERLGVYPWYRNRDLPIPHAGFRSCIAAGGERLAEALTEARIQFLGATARVLPAGEFNRRVARRGNKSLLEFDLFSEILLWLIDSREYMKGDAEEVRTVVDKQGGRDRYGALIRDAFENRVIRVIEQGRRRSCYEVLGRPAHRICFEAKSEERMLPVALSSMVSKYLRELFMLLFNRFWRSFLPRLKPTAGYPQDARRFLAETDDLRGRLGVDEGLLIRSR
jgi:hypothetical protein